MGRERGWEVVREKWEGRGDGRGGKQGRQRRGDGKKEKREGADEVGRKDEEKWDPLRNIF